MYVFDTSLLWAFGRYYPAQFPTIWKRVDELIKDHYFRSAREVKREIEHNCPFEHIAKWVRANNRIFESPGEDEAKFIAEMFRKEQYRGLVKRQNMLKGLPVADPFVIAAAKIHNRCVIGIECINVEDFLKRENLKY